MNSSNKLDNNTQGNLQLTIMKPVVSINNLTKSFGHQKAVDDLSFEVNKGDIFAFLGSNGSGKTTTIRCLLNIYRPDSGSLLINGQPYSHKLNKQIGYLPEERGLYTRAKVIDLFVYFANLRGINTQEALELSNKYLKKVNLFEHKDKKISQLSSGMQQKVQLGLAFIHSPEILILDEPFKGLDPLNRQLFIDIFRDLKEQGVTILYSTHVIDEAQKLTDRLVIIHQGERKAYGSVEEVRKNFGSKNIQLEFRGKLPENQKLYTSTRTNKTAELVPEKGISASEILKFLTESDLEIIKFELDLPSLNQIFINLNKD